MAVRWLHPVAAIAAVAVTFAIPQSAAAQASIQGRVTSEDGQAVQEARVLLARDTDHGGDGAGRPVHAAKRADWPTDSSGSARRI